MALKPKRLKSIIESMLLVSSEPILFDRIVEVIRGENAHTDPDVVKAALDDLMQDYKDPERPMAKGISLSEVGGGYQLRTTPENAAYIRRFLAARPQRMTKAALETLAIIAYRQPVTKPDIESIRGVDCAAVIKALLERDLIRILGKAEEVGRPILYGTTPAFLELFGLKSLGALPTLREYHELDIEHQAQVDELYEKDQPSISDLAATAEFLMERENDPELEALDQAVASADAVKKTSDAFLDPKKAEEGEGDADAAVENAPPEQAQAQ